MYVEQVWRITDLIKMISKWKHEFEVASDLQKLNESTSFQHLVFHVFGHTFDNCMIVRNKCNSERLRVSICKHRKPLIIVTFEILAKRKKLPFYFDILFLDMNNSALTNQRKLADRILNDPMLLYFFYNDSKTDCKV